ncbi:hypothetical protein EK599_04045 [Vibrio sp. T187]|uniref:hypothetical protein n=1 Tax=Vibrio TaxID=662 RepID=UPI0010C955C4|nr:MULTISPECIES: hypothetical protein [Vibrio]MBW3694848.1 hypothetical protein [Vibrio sp. T187]
MLWDTLERVNKLRKQAIEDAEFLESAQSHAQSIMSEVSGQSVPKPFVKSPKKLSDIYECTEFSSNPSGVHH